MDDTSLKFTQNHGVLGLCNATHAKKTCVKQTVRTTNYRLHLHLSIFDSPPTLESGHEFLAW